MSRPNNLHAGDVVEVLSKEEILATLDERGQLDGLPFMPEMFAFCGKQFHVYKRAHKTCDTVNDYKGRRMEDAVHLDGLRCDGSAHGGCEAGCLIYWKNAWLRPVGQGTKGATHRMTSPGLRRTETDVLAGTREPAREADGPIYVCQATQVPAATRPLAWWDVRQYIEDYTSGNVGLARMMRGFLYRTVRNLIDLGVGVGPPVRWIYDRVQRAWGGLPYPGRDGKVPQGERTPSVSLGLQPGELIRVKSQAEILATCDQSTRNRGMSFDVEMVPYCGGTYRVLKRVTRIINERTGRMQSLANPCIILDKVICQARYSACRLFCPRSVYPYWREIWLERVAIDRSGPVEELHSSPLDDREPMSTV